MIPKYQEIMEPLLLMAAEGEANISDGIDRMASHFNLTEEELEERVPSGQQARFANRVTWAKTYLKKAGLLEYPQRGRFRITDRGRAFLAEHPGPITSKALRRFDSFVAFKTPNGGNAEADLGPDVASGLDDATPEEQIAEAYESINAELSAELLERIQDNSPAFFERLLVKLFIAMGYGGSAEEAGKDLGQSGDGGVDGVIDQDPLGVDQVYIQAKRYAPGNTIGPNAIQAFAGALQMKQASKGIFVTTSSFTAGAKDAASRLGARIVLIDGEALGKLMVRYEIGCRTDAVITLRKIDEDFFDNA